MFLQRLGKFVEDNQYYAPGKFNTFQGDIRMPNCTAYAFLRMHEACECKARQNKWIRASGGFGNAKTWFDTTTLPKGYELKEGAIAVFDGNCGHVAYVEHKIDDTHAIISQSQYDADKNRRDYKYFEVRSVELAVGKVTMNGVGQLIGFIYPPIADKRVSRDTAKNQVEIIETYVNVRKSPNGELANKGCYCPTGVYNVLDVHLVDNYKWFKLDDDCWLREGSWTEEYLVDNNALEKLKKENAALQNKLERIKSIVDE